MSRVVIRDNVQNWIGGLYINMSWGLVLGAELQAIWHILQLAKDKVLQEVTGKMDNLLTVQLIYE